jgi:hypothetical protein
MPYKLECLKHVGFIEQAPAASKQHLRFVKIIDSRKKKKKEVLVTNRVARWFVFKPKIPIQFG